MWSVWWSDGGVEGCCRGGAPVLPCPALPTPCLSNAHAHTHAVIPPPLAPRQVIPLEDLGRPRIDVVVNCSGVFRDLFVNQVRLWWLLWWPALRVLLWSELRVCGVSVCMGVPPHASLTHPTPPRPTPPPAR